jgi:hypothetical protein
VNSYDNQYVADDVDYGIGSCYCQYQRLPDFTNLAGGNYLSDSCGNACYETVVVGGRTMTPERKAYFAKCSKREKELREITRKHIVALKFHKSVLTLDFCLTATEKKYRKEAIRVIKYYLNAYRHEIQRLKGMDRVVVPSRRYLREVEDGILVEYEIQTCPNCNVLVGGDLCETLNYCPNCGRRILWEKVK